MLGRTSVNSVIEVFNVLIMKPPVGMVFSAWRTAASMTPPWHTTRHGLAGVSIDDAPDGRTDPELEAGERLATREGDPERIVLPHAGAEPVDEVVHGHAVALGAGVVLAEAVVDDDLGTGKRLDDDLGGLPGPLEVARDDQVGDELRVGQPPVAQPFGLLDAQRWTGRYRCGNRR